VPAARAAIRCDGKTIFLEAILSGRITMRLSRKDSRSANIYVFRCTQISSWFFAVSLLLANFCGSHGATFTYSNTNSIAINDSISPPTKASPYPSTNLISGLAGQIVIKAKVTLHGFRHTFPSDVSILLIGPQGQEAVLMANTGGQERYSVTNLSLTFDDDATNLMPINTTLTNGVFKPTNGYLSLSHLPFDFPSPVAPGNSNSPALLSVFKNTDPTGTWNLFVVDDVSGDSGTISNGWSLSLSVAVPLQITLIQTNVVFSWPATATNCQLQSTPNISALNGWTNILTPPTLNSGHYLVTNSIFNGTMFYRITN
jgi:subtilisin-like proprotein convertase family protein